MSRLLRYGGAVLCTHACMTCSLLMLVEDARGDHMEGEYSGFLTALWVAMSVSICLPTESIAVSSIIICSGLCACTEML